MILTIGMPYSVFCMNDGEDDSFIHDLKKNLTCKIKRYNTFGPPSIQPICLLESVDNTVWKFRTGLLDRVRTQAQMHNLTITEHDLRIEPQRIAIPAGRIMDSMVGKWAYQRDIVGATLKHDMGVVEAATGTGKTNIAAGLIAMRGVSTLFNVHTRELLHQTKSRFQDLLQMPIGIIGDSEYDIQPITISTVQTLNNIAKDGLLAQTSFDMLVQDETHHLPASMFYSVTGALKCRYVYGLSATNYRKDGADLMIEAGAGPVVYKLSPDDGIDGGVLCGADVYFIPILANTSTSEAPRFAIINKYIVNYEPLNKKIIEQAVKWATAGKSVLIAVEWVKHAQILQGMLPGAEVMIGKDDSAKRHRLLQDLSSKKTKVLISTLLKEGVDVPSLDVVINACGGSDPIQLIGRVLRQHSSKDRAIVIQFMMNQHRRLLGASMANMKRCKKIRGFNIVIGEPT